MSEAVQGTCGTPMGGMWLSTFIYNPPLSQATSTSRKQPKTKTKPAPKSAEKPPAAVSALACGSLDPNSPQVAANATLKADGSVVIKAGGGGPGPGAPHAPQPGAKQALQAALEITGGGASGKNGEGEGSVGSDPGQRGTLLAVGVKAHTISFPAILSDAMCVSLYIAWLLNCSLCIASSARLQIPHPAWCMGSQPGLRPCLVMRGASWHEWRR